MKKYILFLVSVLTVQITLSQHVKILYSLRYDLPDAQYRKYMTKNAIEQLKKKQYYYLIKNNESSLFFPNEKPKEFVDRDTTYISNTKREIKEVVIKNDLVDIYYINYPKRYYIRKLKTRGKVYDIKDSLPDLQWTILPETKKLNKYTLQKAQAKYKGTTVTAWFSEDIPVAIGPKIFIGLPGLIMELKMNKLNYKVEKIDFVNNLPAIRPPEPDAEYIDSKTYDEKVLKKIPRGFHKLEKKCSNCPKHEK